MIYLYQFLFLVVHFFSINKAFKNYLFKKLVLFVSSIEGHCQSSGNCCRSIQLFNQEIPITHVNDWQSFLRQFPTFNRFKPVFFNGHIQSFDCQNLTFENQCSDYENRPELCHAYPNSYFLSHGKIHADCGYFIKIDYQRLHQLIPFIRSKIRVFLHLD